MKTKAQATIEDLYNVEGKAELVNGEIVFMSPTGGIPGIASYRIVKSLDEYAQKTTSGYAIPDNVGFVVNLPHRKSFSPDAAFYKGKLTMRFLEGAPIFAAEVRSEGDYGPASEREMAQKRADYFTAGTQVVWDVDLESEDIVHVYRADKPGEPTIFRRGDLANAEPALPGWSMPVDNLFP